MKTLLLIPGAVGLVMAAAAEVCRILGLPSHGREVFIAAIVAVVAAEMALVPALLLRKAAPVTHAQAALGGTMIHFLITVLAGFLILVAGVVQPTPRFVCWLGGAYWLSLVALVWSLISARPQPEKVRS